MEIFKPQTKREAQQKSRTRKSSPRGAVIKKPVQVKQTKSLSFKKQMEDFLSYLSRLNIFKNSKVLAVVLVMSFVIITTYTLHSVKTEKPIERVFVNGDFYQIDKSELELTLSPLVGSNYLDVNIKDIKESLMNYAWVQSVDVRKIWPASLEVNVVENQAIATWGKDGFVNEFGKVFKPEKAHKDLLIGLPDLNGLDKQSDLVLNTYVQLSELSRRSNLKITYFELVANNYWRLKFDQGSEIFLSNGREKQSLETFLEVYQQSLKDSERHLAKVDMRYNNGFSVEFGDAIDLKIGLEKNQPEIDSNRIDANRKAQQQIKSTVSVEKNHG
jgi:cell division protein FtsQ